MNLFHYDPNTFEFIAQTEARRDPEDKDSFLIPAHSTIKIPHTVDTNETNVFNIVLDEWELKPDFRNITYYLKADGSEVFFNLGETPDNTVQDTFPAAIKAELDALKILNDKKAARDSELDSLTYDFGDGRVIQVRPKDESNIRNAIEIMTAKSIAKIGWVMLDDKKYDITIAELQTALASGQSQALTVWNNFNP